MIDHATPADIDAISDMLGEVTVPLFDRHDGCVLVYRLQAVPRGFLAWRSDDTRGRVRLVHVFVEPNFRRHGMARRMIARFEAEIARSGATGWFARTRDAGPSARALMRRIGANGADGVYEKRLQTPHSSSSRATIPR